MSDFISVSYKKRKKNKRNLQSSQFDIYSTDYIPTLEKKLLKARDVLKSSQLYSDVISSLKAALLLCGQSQFDEIICYGLGSFSASTTSQYQLALLVELRTLFQSEVLIYDPVFSSNDKEVLSRKHFKLIPVNEVGKRHIEKRTLFFLPHCPKTLFNNVVGANWGMNLSKCTIIGNSLSEIMCSSTDKAIQTNLPYLYHISSYVTETKIDNNFQYQDIFNDMSIHIFLCKDLQIVDPVVWDTKFIVDCSDVELIADKISNLNLAV